MDFTDMMSTPKGVIIVNTLAAVLLTALGLRLWLRHSMKKAVVRTGSFSMRSSDFGDGDETRRDVARTFAAGCISLVVNGEASQVRPPPGLAAGVDKKAVDEHIQAFAAALTRALPTLDIAGERLVRLLPMLTVNPALSALAAAGEPPMLKQNRFVIRCVAPATKGQGSGATLHCLTIGYVGALPSAPKPDEVLTVASPNLLEAPPAADPGGYALTYALRRAECQRLEVEMALPGVSEVPQLPAA